MSRLFYNIVLVIVIIAGAIRSFLRDMVETVRFWFRRKPERKLFLVTEYPSSVYAWGYLIDAEGRAVFRGTTLHEWERTACQQLGCGAYRMELRFYRIEGCE